MSRETRTLPRALGAVGWLAAVALAASGGARAQDSKAPNTKAPDAKAPDAPEAKGPRLTFAAKDHLFGPTIQGQKVRHAFAFKNTGNAELVIRKVEVTCGCTVSRIEGERVPPGGEGAVELTLDTTEKLGPATVVRATVYSNDPQEVALGPCTTLLELKGEVVTCFKLMPLGAWFGQVLRGREPRTLEIKVSGSLDAAKGFEVRALVSPVDWLKAEAREAKPGELPEGQTGFVLRVTLLPHVPAGEIQQWVTVKTSLERQPTFRFPVVALASGPIKAPEAVIFERVRRDAEVERTIPVERVDGTTRGVGIRSIECDPELFEAAHAVTLEGTRTDVKLKIKKGVRPGPFASPVVVKLDEPEQGSLRFVAFGDVVPRVTVDPPLLLARPGQTEVSFVVTVDGGKVTAVGPKDRYEVALEPAPGGGTRVRLKPARPLEAKLHTTLVVVTDVPGEENVRVPLEVAAAP